MQRMKYGDIIVIAAVLFISVLIIIMPYLNTKEKAQTVEIYKGDAKAVYSLFEDREISITSNGITLTVIIKDGNVSVSHSDCQDKVCVKSGKINKSGEVIVCAPAQVVVKIVGKGGNDAIAG